MKAVEIKKGIYWVGVKDWNLREFHGYNTAKGSTYNAYLVIDEKITLIDCVKGTFTKDFLERISSIVDPSKIDYVVCNHVEMDHSGAMPEVMKAMPNAQILTPAVAEKELARHYDTSRWNFRPVKTGDKISIGKRTLVFTMIPMVHWPDSMMTYIPEEKLLVPNDAFGQHYASEMIFDDAKLDEVMYEAAKYYANIILPYSVQAAKALSDALKFDVDMIAPSHGLIWRKNIPLIVQKYKDWTSGHTENKAVVAYDTMWHSTEDMAKKVEAAFADAGIPTVLRCFRLDHISDILADILEAKYVALGSATINSGIMATVGSFVTYAKGMRPVKKNGFCFGSYGWKKGALTDLEDMMKNLEWTVPEPTFQVSYRPRAEELDALYKSAQKIIRD